MKPVKKEIVYEKVSTDDFVVATIEDIQYETDREFTYKGEKKKSDAVKFKFIIEGMKYPKTTGWMSFSYDERSTLYSKYLTSLVEGSKPYMDFDLDQLKGLKVKMLWKNKTYEGKEYQTIETIRPIGKKVIPINSPSSDIEIAESHDADIENDAIEG